MARSRGGAQETRFLWIEALILAAALGGVGLLSRRPETGGAAPAGPAASRVPAAPRRAAVLIRFRSMREGVRIRKAAAGEPQELVVDPFPEEGPPAGKAGRGAAGRGGAE